jgi:hypothetical protein
MNVTYKDYVQFFETVAQAHIDILHVDEANCSFYTADIDELLTGLRSTLNKNKFVLLLINYNRVLNGMYSNQSITFFVVKFCQPKNFEDQRTSKDQAEEIAIDILGFIKEKSLNVTNATDRAMWGGSFDEAKNVDLIQTSLVAGPDRFYGVQVNIEIKVPLCLNRRLNKLP